MYALHYNISREFQFCEQDATRYGDLNGLCLNMWPNAALMQFSLDDKCMQSAIVWIHLFIDIPFVRIDSHVNYFLSSSVPTMSCEVSPVGGINVLWICVYDIPYSCIEPCTMNLIAIKTELWKLIEMESHILHSVIILSPLPSKVHTCIP